MKDHSTPGGGAVSPCTRSFLLKPQKACGCAPDTQCNEGSRHECWRHVEAYSGQPPFGDNRTFLGLCSVRGLFCHISLGVVLTSICDPFTVTIWIPPPAL